jgi:hypothetical protein
VRVIRVIQVPFWYLKYNNVAWGTDSAQLRPSLAAMSIDKRLVWGETPLQTLILAQSLLSWRITRRQAVISRNLLSAGRMIF